MKGNFNLSKYHFKLHIYIYIDSEEACFAKQAFWHLRCVIISMVSLCGLEGDGCSSLIFADATPGEKKMAEYSKATKKLFLVNAGLPTMVIPDTAFCERKRSVIM